MVSYPNHRVVPHGVEKGKTDEIVKPRLPILIRSTAKIQPFLGRKVHATAANFAINALKDFREEIK